MLLTLSCYSQANIESLRTQAETEKPIAYRYAQEFVKMRLKAPATAQFPAIEQTTIKYTAEKKGDKISYSVAGFVDAQNTSAPCCEASSWCICTTSRDRITGNPAL